MDRIMKALMQTVQPVVTRRIELNGRRDRRKLKMSAFSKLFNELPLHRQQIKAELSSIILTLMGPADALPPKPRRGYRRRHKLRVGCGCFGCQEQRSYNNYLYYKKHL